jgi:hypothetical protein
MNFQNNCQKPLRHTFENLSRVPQLVHGVFTRHDGVSLPPYATLNVAWNNGDAPEAVRENLQRVKGAMPVHQLVASYQTHGDTIHVVDEECLAGATLRHPILFTAPGDALVTRLRGVGLLIKIADCQAVFLVDPVHEVIANIHCGWRGSVGAILEKVVAFLQERFRSRPEDIFAGVSPSLGPCCAEFVNYTKELPKAFWTFQTKAQYFDFWAITRWQLIRAGLQPENIEIANRCTVCESENFFSYRGEKTTGRNAAVLAWEQISEK